MQPYKRDSSKPALRKFRKKTLYPHNRSEGLTRRTATAEKYQR